MAPKIKESEKIGVTQKAFVFNGQGEVLIIKRGPTAPSNPNRWDIPGGGVDFGEDPKESIIREIREETGLEVADIEPFDLVSKVNEDGEFWVSIAWRARAKSSKVSLSYEHTEYKWVNLDEIPNFTDSKRFARFLETHKKKNGG